ncbi:MAG: hypothetical protein LBL78_06245 [Prevotellaceae bacterium]|jgi:hypothetical protein|nr:hypothetical protein [Prevotellaceae bacterium]
MKNKLLLFTTIVAAAFLASCSNDNDIPGLKSDECEVDLQLAATYRSAGTRAVDIDEEVKTLDILVFDGDGVALDSAKFQYSRVAWLKSDGTTYQATIKKADGLDLYFAVNVHSLVTSGQLVEGTTTWSAAKKLLMLTNPSALGTNLATAGLPMWGEALNVNINTDATYQNLGTIKLVRSVASTDVTVTKTNFTLEQGYLVNGATTGYLPYDSDNMSGANSYLFTKADMPTPIAYADWSYTVAANDSAIVNQFYMYENDSTLNTKVILKGTYLGADGKGTSTYYPLAFKDPADPTKKRAVTRNTKFNIIVTKVNADGYGSLEEAKDGEEVNMEYDVVDWDVSNPGDIWIDGPKYFNIDQRWKDVQTERYADYYTELAFQTNYDVSKIKLKLRAADPGVADTLATARFQLVKLTRTDATTGAKTYAFKISNLKDYDAAATDNPQEFIIDVDGKLSFVIKVTQKADGDLDWDDGYDVVDSVGAQVPQYITPIIKLTTHE